MTNMKITKYKIYMQRSNGQWALFAQSWDKWSIMRHATQLKNNGHKSKIEKVGVSGYSQEVIRQQKLCKEHGKNAVCVNCAWFPLI